MCSEFPSSGCNLMRVAFLLSLECCISCYEMSQSFNRAAHDVIFKITSKFHNIGWRTHRYSSKNQTGIHSIRINLSLSLSLCILCLSLPLKLSHILWTSVDWQLFIVAPRLSEGTGAEGTGAEGTALQRSSPYTAAATVHGLKRSAY